MLINSTFPVIIRLGDAQLTLHAVTEVLSFFVAYRYYVYLKRRSGDAISSENRLWIILGATIGALLGSRLVGGMENFPALLNSTHPLTYLYLNKTILGGFLGGIWGVELVKLAIGEKRKSGDLFVYPILLGLIIGRIGCFSMGVHEETYGLPTSSFLGMDLGDGLMRHPVSLYEIVFLLLLWMGLKQCEKRLDLSEGALFKLLMIAYFCFRFLLDFIKPHYTWPIGLSTIQMVSLVGLLYYLPDMIKPRRLIKTAYA
ncbi:prolipoprotein diacylglyceryl transferase [Olivibacter ginsenosidimutans]|uniref:Prolipoprotein diacylglyceryl transferase n=2 Tax=Olivibacter ginsenosidimutans TaxID=1176537 RepID=A0ABP9C9C6_9SPHI